MYILCGRERMRRRLKERDGLFLEREKWRKEEKSPGNRGKSPHFIK
jgi:hypothetical protein